MSTLLAAPAAAESALRLPLPTAFGEIDADTYDEEGHRLGDAKITVVKTPDGLIELRSLSQIEGSARTLLTAVLEPVGQSETLRLVSQRSESHDENGKHLGVMSIDHRRRVARCNPPEGAATELALGNPDRVVNVPLLLFQRLLRDGEQGIGFDILLCRPEARLIGANAVVETGEKGPVVEVRTAMDLGPILSRLAAPFLPRLSVWLDPATDGQWIGHRLPLFSQGPTVVVVRSGVPPALLGVGR